MQVVELEGTCAALGSLHDAAVADAERSRRQADDAKRQRAEAEAATQRWMAEASSVRAERDAAVRRNAAGPAPLDGLGAEGVGPVAAALRAESLGDAVAARVADVYGARVRELEEEAASLRATVAALQSRLAGVGPADEKRAAEAATGLAQVTRSNVPTCRAARRSSRSCTVREMSFAARLLSRRESRRQRWRRPACVPGAQL